MRRVEQWAMSALIRVVILFLISTAGCTPSVQGAAKHERLVAARRVVVLPFAVSAGAPTGLSDSLADELTSRLVGTSLVIIDRAQVVAALTNQEMKGADLAEPAVATRVG